MIKKPFNFSNIIIFHGPLAVFVMPPRVLPPIPKAIIFLASSPVISYRQSGNPDFRCEIVGANKLLGRRSERLMYEIKK